jgi:hypothetical protein
MPKRSYLERVIFVAGIKALNQALFVNHPVKGCIFKMCRNFTYEVVGQRGRIKATKKIVQGERNSMSQVY